MKACYPQDSFNWQGDSPVNENNSILREILNIPSFETVYLLVKKAQSDLELIYELADLLEKRKALIESLIQDCYKH